jgi:hypothetical protein
MDEHTTFICPRCEIGMCRPGETTYVQIVAGQMMSVPNMHVHTCDICGYREFERMAMERLQALVGEVDMPAEDTQLLTKTQALDFVDLSDLNIARRPKT